MGAAALERVSRPQTVEGQQVAGLPILHPTVQALFQTLVLFALQPAGFANKDLRPRLEQLLGLAPSMIGPGHMTYHLRRLRLHGLITRVPHSHRYEVTP